MHAVAFILNQSAIRIASTGCGSLLSFLRDTWNRRGVKPGCGDGRCGSCVVLLGRVDEGRVVYRAVPACMVPMAGLTDTHVVTIEGLGGAGLSVIQRLLIDQGGVMCGYCSPGLVMALTAFCLGERHDRVAAREAIAGAICPCGGYKAIERTALALAEHLDTLADKSLTGLVAAGYLPDWMPRSASRLISGDRAIGRVSRVRRMAGKIVIDGGVVLTDLCRVPLIRRHVPALVDVISREIPLTTRNHLELSEVLGDQDRYGAIVALFLVLGTVVEIDRDGRTFGRPLTDLIREPEVEEHTVIRISFTVPEPDDHLHLERISDATVPAPSLASSALLLRSSRGGTIERAALAMSGVERRPNLLIRCGGLLRGRTVDAGTIDAVIQQVRREVEPINDARGTVRFKRIVARQLVTAHFRELFPRFPEADR